MTENNVIQFPKSYESQEDDKVRLPQTEDEVMKAIAVNRMVFVDEDEFFRDFIMIGELTRSILYNSVGIEHPMHGVVTENRAKLKKLMDSGDIKFTDSSDEDNDEYYEDDDN